MLLLPSLKEVVVSGELLVVLWPVRVALGKLQSEAAKERKRLVKAHVKDRHMDGLYSCQEGECVSLTQTQPELLPELQEAQG